MPDGFGPGKGYDLVVDGVNRSFRDRYQVAVASAIYMKERWPSSLIQIRDCENGNLITVLPDGRLG